VAITSPTSSANFSTPNETVNLAGTANDNIGLVQVTWVNDRGGSGTAAGTTSWSISNVSLQQGTNVIAVTGNDAANNTGTDVISVVYTPSSPVTILINGIGTVSPNLNGQMLQIGKSYTVTATPGTGYVFSSWTGAVTSSVPALTFLMQSNMVFQANFIPNPFIAAAGNYQGLFYQTNGATHQSSGFFSATVTSAGLFTAKLLSEGKAYSLKGKFSGTGVSSNSVARTGMTPLTVQLRLDTISNDTLNGEISSGTWMAELIANRATFNSVNHPAPQTGKYTMIIPSNSTASTEPGGDGFGTVLVDGSGNVTFKGVLSDGTKVAQKAVVSKAGQWPFYIPLYTGKGSIFGWLTFSNQPSLDIDGLVDWFKLPQPIAKLYPLGFAIQTEVVGSSYHFSVGVPVLNLAAGQVWCENGNLTESFTNQITLDAASKVTNHSSNRLALTITTTSGLFKGSVMNPQTSSAIPFTGVVLQKPNFGSGYFLGTNQSGRIYFGP
jgi:hypothetical protein